MRHEDKFPGETSNDYPDEIKKAVAFNDSLEKTDKSPKLLTLFILY